MGLHGKLIASGLYAPVIAMDVDSLLQKGERKKRRRYSRDITQLDLMGVAEQR
jgi:dihydrodipicolinate synthase/N-acetylneuraminate lyase